MIGVLLVLAVLVVIGLVKTKRAYFDIDDL
jgi:hypothetical protein